MFCCLFISFNFVVWSDDEVTLNLETANQINKGISSKKTYYLSYLNFFLQTNAQRTLSALYSKGSSELFTYTNIKNKKSIHIGSILKRNLRFIMISLRIQNRKTIFFFIELWDSFCYPVIIFLQAQPSKNAGCWRT